MGFQPGYAANADWTPTGGSTFQINVRGWNNDESVTALDVSHTGTGGLTAYIAGLGTVEGSIDFDLDIGTFNGVPANSGNNPWATGVGLKAGFKGVFRFDPQSVLGSAGNYTTAYIVPVLIEKVNIKSAVDGKMSLTVNFKLDAISGTFAYPT